MEENMQYDDLGTLAQLNWSLGIWQKLNALLWKI